MARLPDSPPTHLNDGRASLYPFSGNRRLIQPSHLSLRARESRFMVPVCSLFTFLPDIAILRSDVIAQEMNYDHR
jgi:hypothetical protein